MKISSAKIKLANKDLQGIIEEYVEIPGLYIDNINIKELITIEGSYTNKVNFKFKAIIGVGRVFDNILTIKIMKIKISKLPIIKGFIQVAINKALKSAIGIGIKAKGDNIIIDMNILSKFIPFVYFNIGGIELIKDYIVVDARDIIYATDKPVEVIEKPKHQTKEIEKVKDNYTEIRNIVKGSIPEKYKAVMEYIMIFPDICALLGRLLKDKRVSLKHKIIISSTLAYLAFPIDIFPDIIPFVGKLDDIGVVFFVLDKIVNEVSTDIILENWQGKEDILITLEEGAKFMFNTLGSAKTANILRFIGSKVFRKNKKR